MFKVSKAFSSFSVNDIPKAREFYEKILGLEVTDLRDNIELHIRGENNILVYPKEDHTPATFTVLNFPVDDMEKAVNQLTEAGVKFEKYDMPGAVTDERGVFHGEGYKIAWFKDPAGNILSIIEGM